MIKLIALYQHPEDKAAFDKHYEEVHTPLVKAMPGLQRLEIARVTGAPMGESPYYLIAEMYWEDAAAMQESLGSPEGRAVGKDARTFGNILSMHIAEVET